MATAAKATSAKADENKTDEAASAPAPIVNDTNTGPTAAEAVAEAEKDGHVTGEAPGVTRAEGEVPGTVGHTAPGDAPHDTTDPAERVSTAPPSGKEMAEAAKAGLGSVVAYVKTGEVGGSNERDADAAAERTERYPVTVNAITGETVMVERNMDTGVSKRVEGEADQGPNS
jgi:hypothetical protein